MLLKGQTDISEVKAIGIHKVVHGVYRSADASTEPELRSAAKKLVVTWKSRMRTAMPTLTTAPSTISVYTMPSTPTAAQASKPEPKPAEPKPAAPAHKNAKRPPPKKSILIDQSINIQQQRQNLLRRKIMER